MAKTQNPNQERDRNRHTQDPPPTDSNQRPSRERPMDDPGRGHGDKFERQLPGNRDPDPTRDQNE
jgi:hypothetical protein